MAPRLVRWAAAAALALLAAPAAAYNEGLAEAGPAGALQANAATGPLADAAGVIMGSAVSDVFGDHRDLPSNADGSRNTIVSLDSPQFNQVEAVEPQFPAMHVNSNFGGDAMGTQV